MTRKAMDSQVRGTKSMIQLVQNINRMIRTDYGGKDHEQAISEKLKSLYFVNQADPDFEEVTLKPLSQAIHKIISDRIEGIRKATSHDREELLRRLNGTETSL